LDTTFERAANVCMNYCILIVDGGFELVRVTLPSIALQFHGFTGGF